MTWPWWLKAAVGYAALVPLLGVGNLAGGDSGPMSGKLLAIGASLAVAGAIAAGVRLRRVGRRRLGSGLIALGVFPASSLVMFFWFPPVAVVGVVAMVVTAMAATDALDAAPGPATSRPA